MLGRLEHWNRRMSKPICLPGLKTPTVKQVCHWSASFPSPVHLPTFLLPICLSSYLRHPSPYLSVTLCLSSDLSIQPSIYLYACASNCPSMCLLFICLSVCPPVGLSLGKFGLPMTLGLDGTWQTWYFSSAFATCRLNKILRIGRPAQQDAAP